MIRIGSAAAVEKQLDQLETILNTFVVAVLVVLIASSAASKSFEFLGFKLDTSVAYPIVTAVFDCLLLCFCHLCLKIADLIKYSQRPETDDALTVIFTHKLLLSPFSYCGPSQVSIANCTLGSVFLAIVWWIGMASVISLAQIAGPTSDFTDTMFRCLYPVLGVTAIITIGRVFSVVFERLDKDLPSEAVADGGRLRATLVRAIWAKCLVAFIASCWGGWFCYALAHVA